MAHPAPFWMVCRAPMHPNAITAPKHRFASRHEAKLTAQTLANQQNAPFVVLASEDVIYPATAGKSLFDTL